MNESLSIYRKWNLGALWALLGCCVFFTFYDILVEKIWWTTFTIYIPCTLIFSLGIRAWSGPKYQALLIFTGILVFVDIALIGYGIFLLVNGENLWGPLTLGFSVITILLTWSAWVVKK